MKTVLTAVVSVVSIAAGAALATDDGMFPFVVSYDAPDNVVNMSHLLDAPAGKNGRIRVKDGHFADDKGRVRLHATNLTGPANFPSHEEAERLAARLARFGVNCVRLHEAWRQQAQPLGGEMIAEGKFDGPVAPDGRTWILDKGSAKVTVGAEGGALRVSVTTTGGEYFPKIYRRVQVKKDFPYTVSFRIRRTSGKPCEIGFAVANRSRGWESLGVITRIAPTTKWTEHSFSFYAADDVSTAEIQFTRFGEGTHEIDDLSFKTGGASMEVAGLSPEKGEIPIVPSRGCASPSAPSGAPYGTKSPSNDRWLFVCRDAKAETNCSAEMMHEV